MIALRRGSAVHAIARELETEALRTQAASAPTVEALRAQAQAIFDIRAPTLGAFVERIAGMEETAAASLAVELHSLPLSSIVSIHRLIINATDQPGTSVTRPAEMRCLSFEAIARARTTLADFSNFYFAYHGLSRGEFFRWLPQLVFAEACIYQLDEDNERACLGADVDPGCSREALRGVLANQGLLAGRVEALLSDGERYWALERKLCGQMLACEPLCIDEVFECSRLKSFDYRCLHAMLCALIGMDASEELLLFLRVDEMLTDMADDLFDYEKDVRKNSFNVLRGCVHALGVIEAPLALAAKIGELEKEHEMRLAALPAEVRESWERCRRDAMKVPGSEKWRFPPVVSPQAEVELRQNIAKVVSRQCARGGRAAGVTAGSADGQDDDAYASDSEIESDAEGGPTKRKRWRTQAGAERRSV